MTNHKDNIKDIAEHLIKAEFQIRRSKDQKNKEANISNNSLNNNIKGQEKNKD